MTCYLIILLTLMMGTGTAIAQEDSNSYEKNPSTEADTCTMHQFEGWTEEQIRQWEDSIIAASYPQAKFVRMDTALITKNEPANPVDRESSKGIVNRVVPNSVEIDTSKGVGEIPINSGTSPTGAKTYEIPISVYPGMKGMQPSLALVYNSQAGNSIVGMGWHISGLSSITRGSKNIYYDNEAEGVKIDKNDALYLDGMRLIKLSTYSSYILYQSEVGNIKVKGYYTGTVLKYFEVFYPDGNKGVFGYPYNLYDRVAYPMTSLTDLQGNAISYNYSFNNNHYSISSISYNGASVTFQYQDSRNDTILTYCGGTKLIEPRRLQSITCKLGTTVLGTYTLTYDEYRFPSFLSQVEYTSNGQSLNPLRFYYGRGNADPSHTSSTIQLTTYYTFPTPGTLDALTGYFDYLNDAPGLIVHQHSNPYWQHHRDSGWNSHSLNTFENLYDELNNDLKTIISYIDLGEGGLALENTALTLGNGFIKLLCADLQGNQKEDIIKINNSVVNGLDHLTFKVFRMSPYGVVERYTRTFDFQTIYWDASGNKSIQPKYYYVGDFNGDGRMEIMAISVHEPFEDYTLPSMCYIFDLENNQIMYQAHLLNFDKAFHGDFYPNKEVAENNSDKLLVMDIDGDGKTDVCHINANNVTTYTFQSSGGTWSARVKGVYPTLNRSMAEYREVFPCELNGDGLNDILIISPRSEHGSAPDMVFYSKGNGQFEKKDFYGIGYPDNATGHLIQDVNGDGLTDVHTIYPHCFSTDMGIDNVAYGGPTCSYTNNSLLIPASFNSRHSFTRMLSLKDGTLTKHQFKARAKDYTMTGMANSMGVIEKTEYKRIDEAFQIHQMGNPNNYEPTFPYVYIHEPLHVVSRTELFMNGSCADFNDYAYRDAIAHRQGLGFLGFRQLTRQNSRSQNFTSFCDPERRGVLTHEVTPEKDVTYTYSVNIASNKIAKILMTGKVETDLLKGNIATSTYTYNSYGYPLTQTTSYTGGMTVNTQNTYTSNTTVSNGYHLGFLINQFITKTKGSSTVVERMNIPSSTSRLPNVKVQYINGNQVEKHTYTYDNNGNPLTDTKRLYTSTTDYTTTYTYDTKGRVTSVTDPLGLTTHYTYNTKGQRATMVDFRGNTTTYTYDAFGRETTVTHPASIVNTTTYSWSTLGTNGLYAITQTETGKPTTRTIYDALNREVRSSDMRFDGIYRNVDKQYDTYGNLWKVSLPFKGGNTPSYWNTYTYDTHNRLLSLAEASGRTTTHSYSGNSVTTVEDNITTTKTYDATGNIVSVTDPAGTVTYNLAADGQPISIVAPGNVTTSFTYDNYRRRTSLVDPSAGTTTYQYDAAGNISKEINANGDSIQYTYDNKNRLSWIYRPEFNTYHIYNNTNDLIVVWGSNGTQRTMTYDSFGRLATCKESVDSVWMQKSYSYANGNVSNIITSTSQGGYIGEFYTYSNGHFTEGRYNATQLLFRLTAENALGQPTQVETGSLTRDYVYTAYGYPSARTVGSIQQLSYTFNPVTGNLMMRMNHKNGYAEYFSYDTQNRLTSWNGPSATYDGKGNILSMSDAGTFSYGLSSKPYAITGVTNPKSLVTQREQDITYTSFSRPATIEENGYTVSFTYNSDGEKVKMVKSQNGNIVSTKYYLGGCYETTLGNTENFYLFGDYYNATAVSQKTNNTYNVFHLLRDSQGSVTHVIHTTGFQLQELSYDAWGRLRYPATYELYPASNLPEVYFRGYCGHEHLKEFGLINMNARLYDPAIGRFLSPDPYVQMPENSQNFNRYSYCLNNPLKYTDESGEIITEWIILGAFIGGTFNLGYQFYKGNIHNVGQALFAFTIGASAVVAGAYTGGFAFGLTGGGAAGAGGFLAGFAAGMTEGVTATAILSEGNHALGDERFPWQAYLIAGGTGGLFRGTTNAMSAYFHGKNVWTGEMVAEGRNQFSFNNTPRHSISGFNTGSPSAPNNKNIRRPLQTHHFATDKNKTFTPQIKEISEKYKLNLNDDWNKAKLPHIGRHPNEYHQWVLRQMMEIDRIPNMTPSEFIFQFNNRIIKPVIDNPEMIYKSYWIKP